jgi:hypothetical protein
MLLLSQGKVVVTNWHVFEPQVMQTKWGLLARKWSKLERKCGLRTLSMSARKRRPFAVSRYRLD